MEWTMNQVMVGAMDRSMDGAMDGDGWMDRSMVVVMDRAPIKNGCG